MYYKYFNDNIKYDINNIDIIDKILNLENIKILDVSNNKNNENNEKIQLLNLFAFKNLENFNCDNCKLTRLPILPYSIISLSCKNNNLTELTNIKNFSNLQYLNCSFNKITKLIILPNKLLTLTCDDNLLNKLLKLPTTLETLDLVYYYIKTLPKSILLCKNLTYYCYLKKKKIKIYEQYNKYKYVFEVSELLNIKIEFYNNIYLLNEYNNIILFPYIYNMYRDIYRFLKIKPNLNF